MIIWLNFLLKICIEEALGVGTRCVFFLVNFFKMAVDEQFILASWFYLLLIEVNI